MPETLGLRMCINFFWVLRFVSEYFSVPTNDIGSLSVSIRTVFTTRADIEHRKVSNMSSSNIVVVVVVVVVVTVAAAAIIKIIIIMPHNIFGYRRGLNW
jgi:hypothetical protein